MTDKPTARPRGPRAVARAVLAAIEAQPRLFDMGQWAALAPGEQLNPPAPGGEYNICGTPLCAAGWTAHVAGWTLKKTPGGYVLAQKASQGAKRTTSVARAAALELGLSDEETFWYASPKEALRRLREIAELPAD